MDSYSGIKKVMSSSSISISKNQTNMVTYSSDGNKTTTIKMIFVSCSVSITCGVIFGVVAEKAKGFFLLV